MTLFTPRGLKIRLPVPYAFALMARLWPRIDAYRILLLTEEVEHLAALAAFVAGLLVFVLHLSPLQITLWVLATGLIFRLVHLLGFFAPPFTILLPLSRIYSFFWGWGLLVVPLLIFGFVRTGWQGVLAFLGARLACTLLFSFIEFAQSRRMNKEHGLYVTMSERSFCHAFRLSANRLGVSTSLEVSAEEIEPSRWQPVFDDLAMKWPNVVSRFKDKG